ncbi:MAG: deoxyguanosinetriphosphate triphosphohydrolase [Chloroflexi bacterium]|nr:deoxyguanosinetriphosphate triphosphohydrolase [Chloroflexota bacterium]
MTAKSSASATPDLVREWLEAEEQWRLSSLAALAGRSRGRARPEPESEVRTCFQRDRDRVVHSKSFRRLKHKTQVFIAPVGDHYRTRLTHTLEVSQIARTMARALRLNEDLVEAITLAHDVGHTPFGHSGEHAIARLRPDGFRHNLQSLRVVEVLEKGGQGLNLTAEVRDGIRAHSKPREGLLEPTAWQAPGTLEGQLVKLADGIAYINHDIDDALRAHMLHASDLPAGTVAVLGASHGDRINTLVMDVVRHNWWIAAGDQGLAADAATIGMSETVLAAANELRDFMFERVYHHPLNERERVKAERLITTLYQDFTRHPDKLPVELRDSGRGDSIDQMAIDYIAGMTDRFAIRCFLELNVPNEFLETSL